jgi:hypothetical protein
MPFDEPEETGGVRLNPRDIVNHLLLVWVIDYIAHSPTQFSRPDKPSDVIVVDVVDLDQVDETGVPGLLARNTWWRQAQLIQSLKSKIGKKDPVLVRMSKGGATMGRNAPYILTSMTADPQCVNRANLWLAQNPTFSPSVPLSRSTSTPDTMANPDTSHWAQPEAPNLPPPRPVTPAEQSILERMARSSVAGQPGNQGPIPF